MFVPIAVTIPRFLIIEKMGLLDTFYVHILPGLAMPVGLPVQFLGTAFAVRSIVEKFQGNLAPGDIILTGAPGAVEQINPGDVVEVDIPGIGTLRNSVVAEK